MNDSKAPLGSNLDRHETTGAGLIGDEGLRTFLAHPAFQKLPAILETPGPDGHGPDAAEVAHLPVTATAPDDPGDRLRPDADPSQCESLTAAGSSCANTRKLGLATGISKNSGFRQPTSSPRCS